jgi:hypothetical protein
MNAMTVGAAIGLLVLIFQDGRLEGPLAYTSQHGIEQSNYLVLAASAPNSARCAALRECAGVRPRERGFAGAFDPWSG